MRNDNYEDEEASSMKMKNLSRGIYQFSALIIVVGNDVFGMMMLSELNHFFMVVFPQDTLLCRTNAILHGNEAFEGGIIQKRRSLAFQC